MSATTEWATFLPGRFAVGRGTAADYRAMERFHYRAKRPATWAGVWVVRYVGEMSNGNNERSNAGAGAVVGVAVLSFPTVNGSARDRALGLEGMERRARLEFVNAHVRTISRVVVHPQFRGVGLGSRLVAHACAAATTRYVEAFAVMGRVHPFFERGGMRQTEPSAADGPVYYLFDRGVE